MSDSSVYGWAVLAAYLVGYFFYAAYLALWFEEHEGARGGDQWFLAIPTALIWPAIIPFHLATMFWKWVR